MAKKSCLRLYRSIESLEPAEKEYWKAYITKREHLKREYPQGIPMRILFPSGVFEVKEFRGSYAIDGQGKIFVTSSEIDSASIPGPQEVPLPWYLLFTESERYLVGMDNALKALEANCALIRTALDHCRFSLTREESTIYFLQHCDPDNLAGLASYLACDDDVGFIELMYSDLGLDADPLIASRILEDKRMQLFPRQIHSALGALIDGNYSIAEDLFEEVCLIHRYLRASTVQEKPRKARHT
jgi:hypothetical protein